MSKGLDVGTSFIVLSSYEGDNIKFKDFRDAFYVCCLLWPFAHTKLHKIQQVIEHYANEKVNMDNIVDLADFKRRKNVGQNSL